MQVERRHKQDTVSGLVRHALILNCVTSSRDTIINGLCVPDRVTPLLNELSLLGWATTLLGHIYRTGSSTIK